MKEHKTVSGISEFVMVIEIRWKFNVHLYWFFLQEYKKMLLEKRKLGVSRIKPKGPKPKEIIETYTGPRLNIIIKGRNSRIITVF